MEDLESYEYLDIPGFNTLEEEEIKKLFDAQIKVTPTDTNLEKKNYCTKENLLSDDKDKMKIYKYESVKFSSEEEKKVKVILLIGQTGCGKTTLINLLINTLLGTKYNDDYRYKIIIEEKHKDESKSNTKGIHFYNIKVEGYGFPIKIIDTQGFGDTGGVDEDNLILEKIKDTFNSIKYINCICFVVKESDFRLGSSQKYIYKSILDIFAKDVRKNFVLMLTNSHFEEEPENIPVLKTLNLEESFFNTVIPYLQAPYYFQFENGSLYLNNKKKINEMYFKESVNNMSNFLGKLKNLGAIQTENSLKVCIERLRQRILCKNLFNKRELLINKKKVIEENEMLLRESKLRIIEDPNIEIITYELECKKRTLQDGKYNTVCHNCENNCHENCKDTRFFGYDLFKYWCVCFSKTGHCKICKNNCFLDKHEYVNYEYYFEKKKLRLSLDQIFQKKCEKNHTEKNAIDKYNAIIKKNNEEMEEIEKDASEMLEKLYKSLETLNDLALNQQNYQLCIKILDDLIKQEESLGKSKNIEVLKQKRKECLLLSESSIQGKNHKLILYSEDKNACVLF